MEAQATSPSTPLRKESLKDAIGLVKAGKTDEAVPMLYRLRAKAQRSPEIALWLGHAYFRKLWRTDALREYRTALSLRSTYRRDPLLLRNVVIGLDDPTYRPARVLLRKYIGAAALPELRRMAVGSPSSLLRRRANAVGTQIARARRR